MSKRDYNKYAYTCPKHQTCVRAHDKSNLDICMYMIRISMRAQDKNMYTYVCVCAY